MTRANEAPSRRDLGAAAAAGLLSAALLTGLAGAAWAQSRDDSLIGGGDGQQMSCRDVETRVRRLQVAGGQDARVDDFPFIVQVRVGNGLCGGSLIAKRFVMTAAHCVMAPPSARDCVPDGPGKCLLAEPRTVTVTRPSPDGRAGGETLGAVAIVAHPKFRYPISNDDNDALDADIALIRLERDMNVTNGDLINIADTPFDRSFTKGGGCAQVAGWGLTDVLDSNLRVITRGEQTKKLQSLNLELQDQARCKNVYKDQISDNMLCAGDGVEGFNTCKGDSGGPLVVDVGVPIQVGVVSWAYGCAQSEHFTIFTRIGAPEVRRWIDEKMGVRR